MNIRVFTFLASLLLATTASAQPVSVEHGREVYDKWCAPCHAGSMDGTLPGTMALRLKYDGQLPAVLEERGDLSPELIRTVVRKGLYGMPMTRKAEVSDHDLEDIITYLLDRGQQ